MVLASHPARLIVGIFDIFMLIELPNDIAVPIYLDEINIVLIAVLAVAGTSGAHHMATF